jgi:hypothetical protein
MIYTLIRERRVRFRFEVQCPSQDSFLFPPPPERDVSGHPEGLEVTG